jgi:phage terminase large subunit-like protein
MSSRASSPDRFAEFAEKYCGLRLEPFQKLIVAEVFADRRELLVLLPRGNGKTTLFAAIGLFSLLSTPQPAIYVCAASRDQARLLFEIAKRMVRNHPELERRITPRYSELRVDGGFLKVIASDAPLAHGLTPSLVLVDELHAHRDGELYEAMRTSMLKRPGARMVTISTAGSNTEGVLGRLRGRALQLPHVDRSGALTRAYGANLAMLEWAAPQDWDGEDLQPVIDANPCSWIGREALEEQREAVQDSAFRRFHSNIWTSGENFWLPYGSWERCADPTLKILAGERVFVGIDVGGERSASAVVWVTEDLRVGCQVYTGNEAVLQCAAKVRELAEDFTVVEVIADPWRFQQSMLELAQRNLRVTEFPQSNARMGPASERLHGAIVEGRLTHPDDPVLNSHVRAAIARDTPRGWRIDKMKSRDNIDACVALCMAVEAAEAPVQETVFHGWLDGDGFHPAESA